MSLSRLLPVVLILALGCAAVAVVVVQSGSTGAADAARTLTSEQRALERRVEFGLGRELIRAAPGADLRGTIAIPDDITEGEVGWSVDGAATGTPAAGEGPGFAFRAPQKGTATLTFTAGTGADAREQTVTVEVLPRTRLAATNLRTESGVWINGGLPVQGEAIADGAEVDARTGGVTMNVLARTRKIKAGTSVAPQTADVTYEGTIVRISDDRAGARGMTTIAVRRRAEYPNQKLHVQARDVKNASYLQVLTPDAVAMVKGTEFDVGVTYEGTRVDTEEGWVRLYDYRASQPKKRDAKAGKSRTVPARPAQKLDPEEVRLAEEDADFWEEDEERLIYELYGYDKDGIGADEVLVADGVADWSDSDGDGIADDWSYASYLGDDMGVGASGRSLSSKDASWLDADGWVDEALWEDEFGYAWDASFDRGDPGFDDSDWIDVPDWAWDDPDNAIWDAPASFWSGYEDSGADWDDLSYMDADYFNSWDGGAWDAWDAGGSSGGGGFWDDGGVWEDPGYYGGGGAGGGGYDPGTGWDDPGYDDGGWDDPGYDDGGGYYDDPGAWDDPGYDDGYDDGGWDDPGYDDGGYSDPCVDDPMYC